MSRAVALALFVLLVCVGCGHDGAKSSDGTAPAIPPLIEALREGSTTHAEATKRLIQIGAAAVPELIRVARASADTLQRVHIVLVLGEIGPAAESARQVLEEIAKEGIPHLSESAASALESLRRERPAENPPDQTWQEWWEKNRAR